MMAWSFRWLPCIWVTAQIVIWPALRSDRISLMGHYWGRSNNSKTKVYRWQNTTYIHFWRETENDHSKELRLCEHLTFCVLLLVAIERGLIIWKRAFGLFLLASMCYEMTRNNQLSESPEGGRKPDKCLCCRFLFAFLALAVHNTQ